MKDFRKLFLNLIFILVFTVVLLMPSFNLVYVEILGEAELAGIVKINGYDLMSALKAYETYGEFDVWNIMQWIFFMGTVIAMVVIYLSITDTRDDEYHALQIKTALIIAGVYATFYLIQGLVLKKDMKEAFALIFELDLLDKNLETLMKELVKIKTSAFLPLIFVASLSVAYGLVDKYMPTKAEKEFILNKYYKSNNAMVTPKEDEQPVTQATAPRTLQNTQPILSEKDKVECLIKWKELFDGGVITQEEFDEKKKKFI